MGYKEEWLFSSGEGTAAGRGPSPLLGKQRQNGGRETFAAARGQSFGTASKSSVFWAYSGEAATKRDVGFGGKSGSRASRGSKQLFGAGYVAGQHVGSHSRSWESSQALTHLLGRTQAGCRPLASLLSKAADCCSFTATGRVSHLQHFFLLWRRQQLEGVRGSGTARTCKCVAVMESPISGKAPARWWWECSCAARLWLAPMQQGRCGSWSYTFSLCLAQ